MRSTDRMSSGILVGRAWGIPIYVHISWFVIFVLLAWSMAVGILPQAHPEFSTAALWLLGTITSLLFAISVLLHELGHGYAALRNSIPVKNVTLFVFGGLAQIGQEPPTASVEFEIAIAGPLISLTLGMIFAAVWLLAPNLTYFSAPSEWLARINLSLLAFNMIPSFPLDGGRVLRAVLWHFSRDKVTATHNTAVVGEVIALIFIGLGIYFIVSGNLYNGLWLAFIGWFLQSASSAGLAEDVRPRRAADVQNTLYRSHQADYPENRLLKNTRLTGARQTIHGGIDSGAWLGGLPLLPGALPVLPKTGSPQTPAVSKTRLGNLTWAVDHRDGGAQFYKYSLERFHHARRTGRVKSDQSWLIARHSLQVRRGRFR
ncbi:MAG: site-2 protease family protein [Anaerolineaceae bacterium]|nr:site-2 protease family protein [Anaerolineaceae bacterium]